MPDIRMILAVACGAAIGGVVRFLLASFVVSRFGTAYASYATLFINASGSFLIGLVLETMQLRSGIDQIWRSFLAVGVLGGYTTFSTFSYELFSLSTTYSPVNAVLYALASVILGVLGAIAGISTARGVAHV